jgi:hypothetical protein
MAQHHAARPLICAGHDAGKQRCRAHVRQRSEQLHASVFERRDHAVRAIRRTTSSNTATFVGSVRELTDLRNALTKNKLGVVGAREAKLPLKLLTFQMGGTAKR